MYDLIIRDATIIHSTGRLVADIAVEDGKIAYVGGNAAGGAREEIQGIGRFVMPGVIDAHVHLRKPGAYAEDDWATGTLAAVRSGVTTVLDMPDVTPASLDRASIDARLARAREQSLADYGLWVAAGPEGLDGLSDLQASGDVCGTMVYFDRTEGPLALSTEQVQRVLAEGSGLIGVHAESPPVLAKYKRKWQAVEDPVHNDVRPPKAALESLTAVMELVRESERAIHLTSMSTARELNALDPYRGDLPISTQVQPYHLFLSVEASSAMGDRIKVDPPVRGELDRRAMWAAIKRGRIDTFASGHSPLTLDQKAAGYWNTPSGIPGISTMVPLLMSAVKHGRLGLERLVEMCCENPARLFKLENKGRLEVGYDADIVLFTEGETTKLRKPFEESGVGWTPYIGREIGLDPQIVVVGGRVVARSGVLAEELLPAKQVRIQQG